MNLEKKRKKKHYVNSTFSRWPRFWTLAPPPSMYPQVRIHVIKANLIGYLKSKYAWFLQTGSLDIYQQRNFNQNFDPN